MTPKTNLDDNIYGSVKDEETENNNMQYIKRAHTIVHSRKSEDHRKKMHVISPSLLE
jgi:hypothetical protein